jgi:hypothetical protein
MKKKNKKISALIPADLLIEATKLSDCNQTDAIIFGLQELIRAKKRNTIFDLKGKMKINFNVELERERTRF